MRIAEELGVEAEIVLYIKNPPDAATLRAIIAKLEDSVTDLVRRDSMWKKLGLTDADAATEEQVVALLVRHKQLLQRPVVVTAEKAIIGRPKERVLALLSCATHAHRPAQRGWSSARDAWLLDPMPRSRNGIAMPTASNIDPLTASAARNPNDLARRPPASAPNGMPRNTRKR